MACCRLEVLYRIFTFSWCINLSWCRSRYIMGNASGGKRAQDAGEKANGLIQIAWSYIQRENVLSQSSIWIPYPDI
ncbi:hypothetical protein HanXRQr2_Chr05g0206861 [Helianthus annuus]|uniref:Uncharacterized protein n=1 Tax=Helianthus annuus TaxID=4232 RepID=A0A9K3NLR3_HELAN|nr:hypothetical protein HanXRQr2_Chr05g0206861 [Helianthus annuus]